ncbi:MAG TPA: site-specific integrase [Methanomicrobia archaeon]|nr:site-specific integrase [Methanomicrobia archaeon]
MINTARMRNRRDELFLKLLWMTGVRVSEATAITSTDIKEGSLRIYGKAKPTLKGKRGKKGKLKDGKRERYIPLPDSLRADLYSYIFDAQIESSERIFPFTTRRAYQLVKRYADLAGVEQNREAGIHPHLFRHGFALNFLKQTHTLGCIEGAARSCLYCAPRSIFD